jgi:hypothetical protein
MWTYGSYCLQDSGETHTYVYNVPKPEYAQTVENMHMMDKKRGASFSL